MAKGLIERQILKDIADAIREKNGTNNPYAPSAFAGAIRLIQGGGGEPGENDGSDMARAFLENNLSQIINSTASFIASAVFLSNANITKAECQNVRTIHNSAFANCSNLMQASFANVETICSSAFYGCRNMEEVYMPKCQSIQSYAFAYNYSLQAVDLPLIEVLGNSTFVSCSSIKSVNIPECTTVGDYAFVNCISIENVNMPKVKVIGSNAFSSCKLSSVYLPECSYIRGGGLALNQGITELDLPALEKTDYSAFYADNYLLSASLPKCSYLGGNAFAYCIRMTSVNFPALTKMGGSVFKGCSTLTDVSLPNLSYIEYDNAFAYCSSLSYIELPSFSSYSRAASNMFMGCSKLESVYFPKLVYVPSGMLEGCSKLISANIPKIAYVQSSAFKNCVALPSAPSGIMELSNSVFYGCTGLVSASCGRLTRVDNYAFAKCSALVDTYFPYLGTIGEYAFLECSSLSNLSLPNGHTILTAAFSSCTNLQTLTIGRACSISGSAFWNCRKLSSLYLTSKSMCTLEKTNAFTSTPIGGYTGHNNGEYGKIYVAADLYKQYKKADVWSYYANRIYAIGGATLVITPDNADTQIFVNGKLANPADYSEFIVTYGTVSLTAYNKTWGKKSMELDIAEGSTTPVAVTPSADYVTATFSGLANANKLTDVELAYDEVTFSFSGIPAVLAVPSGTKVTLTLNVGNSKTIREYIISSTTTISLSDLDLNVADITTLAAPFNGNEMENVGGDYEFEASEDRQYLESRIMDTSGSFKGCVTFRTGNNITQDGEIKFDYYMSSDNDGYYYGSGYFAVLLTTFDELKSFYPNYGDVYTSNWNNLEVEDPNGEWKYVYCDPYSDGQLYYTYQPKEIITDEDGYEYEEWLEETNEYLPGNYYVYYDNGYQDGVYFSEPTREQTITIPKRWLQPNTTYYISLHFYDSDYSTSSVYDDYGNWVEDIILGGKIRIKSISFPGRKV